MANKTLEKRIGRDPRTKAILPIAIVDKVNYNPLNNKIHINDKGYNKIKKTHKYHTRESKPIG
ncbi:MAG: hypothetical protein JSW73_03275 [Candidatus Woesearchaeota archaeon]|nr:MAG: hypothetical protein JSW73_03275 [Candidatus Woesearchaeota archaeon]